jgi:hypothetical protein
MKRVFAISMMVALAFGGLTYAGNFVYNAGDSLITDGTAVRHPKRTSISNYDPGHSSSQIYQCGRTGAECWGFHTLILRSMVL